MGNVADGLADYVQEQTEQCLTAYRAKPNLIEQDAGIELANVEGGYGRKQLHELVQNAADALLGRRGKIALVLSNGFLYAANEGNPLTRSGIESLMASHLSRKRDDEIGRFGLGFKSVLGITDRPEIISRAVSIRFDRAVSERLCREIWPQVPRTPVLRIGFPFYPQLEAAEDKELAELMQWATTVVRLPLKDGADWVGGELANFPSEILLFTEHVEELELRDVDSGQRSVWRSERAGDTVVLRSGDKRASWQVFKTTHRPSSAARADAGTISGRGQIDVSWAVPTKDRGRPGKLWAHFPTNSVTTLSGIVNAPFKTNEDRHDILNGLYNREILQTVLPNLISENISALVVPADPASILEILPGRGKEARSWADDVINEPIYQVISRQACLPDMDGVLRRASQVKLHPVFLAELDSWKRAWAAVHGRPADWVHHSVDRTTERRAKAERIIRSADNSVQTVDVWLHDLAAAGGVVGSQEAIKLAALVERQEPDHMIEMRRSAFVLAADGSLQLPTPGQLFLPESAEEHDAKFVAPAVVSDGTVTAALEGLGIGRLDQRGRLREHIAHMKGDAVRGPDVEKLWNLVRGLPAHNAAAVLTAGFGHGNTPVRSMARQAERIEDMLLPGEIVPSDGSRDDAVTIDMTFHAPDSAVLRELGAVSEPALGRPGDDEKWYRAWKSAAVGAYREWADVRGMKPQRTRIRILEGKTVCGLDIAEKLSEDGRAAVTKVVLRAGLEPWRVDATGGAEMPFVNPAVWWVKQYGVVPTAFGLRAVKDCYGPIDGIPDRLLPVALLPARQVSGLGLRTRLETSDWVKILKQPWRDLSQAQLNELYGYAAKLGASAPDGLGVVIGSKETVAYPEETFATADPTEYKLVAAQHAAILVTDREHVAALIDRWRLRDAAEVVNRTVLAAPSGEPVLLGDRFPGLRAFLKPMPDVELTPCSDLSMEVMTDSAAGPTVTEHTVLRDGERRIFFLDNLGDAELLEALKATLRAELGTVDTQKVLEIEARGEANRLRARVSRETDQNRKLVMLAGVEALRRELPPGAVRLAEKRRGRKLRDEEIATMAHVAKGAKLLSSLAPAIEENGITLPSLSGGFEARAAIRDLGLTPEFAGARNTSPPPRFQVIGPVALPSLHDYQEKVVANLLNVLRSGGRNRGLVALPTGSGKTRVAVESIIRFIAECDSEPLVIWIAQSNELCEQAVETWSYTWSAIAPPGAKLTISRLWGANDATPAEEGSHLVVATDDKLLSLRRRGQHDWLTEAHVALVDEAHSSISKTYTELFDWLKRGARQRDRTLVGLSATPYRGRSEEQTRALINRYDSNLVTDGILGDDPYRELQEMGMLARVSHLELEGMVLTPGKHRARSESESMHFDDYRIDLTEVAADSRRNEAILDSLESLPPDMTALVFAASVQHAEILAAVLGGNGIPAAAIAAHTAAAERRRLIEQFRTGEVRILTNYNVLSQGFDAPKVGAVYVTRPTFSPNRYQQMIGRGLRGPRNGGSEEVLIVNVRDNIEAFGTQLAFYHFDKLWTAQ